MWRDFKFVLNQVTRTIEPALPLVRMISEWNTISRALAEPPRHRLSQLSGYFDADCPESDLRDGVA